MKKSTIPVLPKIVVIVGPTASGKTALGIALARKFNGEIISADSRQIYRGMDIGTGKATKREMRGILHHMIDIASPKRVISAEEYLKGARAAIRKVAARGKVPIVVGGTGFYVDALVNGTSFPAVPPNMSLRKKLGKETVESLFKKLQRLDPRRAAGIDRHNKVRLIRAIEIVTATGAPVPALQNTPDRSRNNFLILGVSIEKSRLRKNIAVRLAKRFRAGMIAEVAKLKRSGVSAKRLHELGLEYRHIGAYLQGLVSKKEMASSLEKDIHHYAKRQMTWFKRNKNIRWIKSEVGAKALVKRFLG